MSHFVGAASWHPLNYWLKIICDGPLYQDLIVGGPRWSSEHATYAQNSPTNIHKSSVAARDVVVGEMMENQFTGRSRRLHFLFLRVKNVFSVRDIVDRCCSEQCAINIFWSGRELHLSFQVSTCGFISLQQSFCSADEDCPTFGRTRCKGLSIGLCLTG